MTEAELSKIARQLDTATSQGKAVERITLQHEGLTLEQAYRIQDVGMRLRLTRGERHIGMKMGLTSLAKMQQMGVHEPIFGGLTETMQVGEGTEISLQGRIHPRIEPEVAFLLGKDLEGNVSPAQALQACSGVCAALEIIDSRFKNFEFQLPDVVADNCSASGFILGSLVRRPDFDLANLGIVMEVDGQAVQFASSASILGHPARSLAELVRMLSARGQGLRAGSIVLAGGATAAVPLKAGSWVRVQVQGLGSASIRVAKE